MSFHLENDDQEPTRRCCAEGGMVAVLGPPEDGSAREDLLGLFWLDPMAERQVKFVAIIPLKS
jgi:hypothetical protein